MPKEPNTYYGKIWIRCTLDECPPEPGRTDVLPSCMSCTAAESAIVDLDDRIVEVIHGGGKDPGSIPPPPIKADKPAPEPGPAPAETAPEPITDTKEE